MHALDILFLIYALGFIITVAVVGNGTGGWKEYNPLSKTAKLFVTCFSGFIWPLIVAVGLVFYWADQDEHRNS